MSFPAFWIAAICALVPAFGVAVATSLRGTIAHRFAGMQLATALAVYLTALMTFAIDQPSSIDLAITVVLLGLPGSLLIAVFLERWL